ncbi:MAG: ABC transporter ATP-binding protein [Clostridiales bacterium]|nr:ABC transporter ATP-binding protein [Clostridiales bacterium]
MSVSIQFENVVKKYGSNTIIPGLSLDVKDGEFFTLLGPSGCGKTTLLRMVAGFNTIEGGQIRFGDTIINDMHPSRRNIGMVFQNYAIFPHMTVKANVAFGLKNRKIARSEIEKRVDEILEIVRISDLKDRLPQNMSGGQQQRVALARAIVIHPDVLLMDEPLSNLDAKLRLEMRSAIRTIQHSVGITTIYVTHDQEEALAISDRIGVMNGGVLQHVGTPRSIYQRPANLFVANFIGRSNEIGAECKAEGSGHELVFGKEYRLPMSNLLPGSEDCSQVRVCIRPEEFIIARGGEGLDGIVEDSIFLGLNTHFFIRLTSGQQIETIAESEIDGHIPSGSKVKLRLKAHKINVFSKEGSKNLVRGVQNDAQPPQEG